MINDLGYFMLVISVVATIFAIFAALKAKDTLNITWMSGSRRAVFATFILLSISSIATVINLVTGNYQVRYAYETSSKSMPTLLKFTALWGGQEGSILFWTWLMAGFIAVLMLRKWHEDRELMPWVIIVAMGTVLFFQLVVLFISNPFERMWFLGEELVYAVFQPAGTIAAIPYDGEGLNPLLRHPGMIGHPPTLYLGFVGFVVPYAYAIAALITGKAGEGVWIRTTRRWTLVAWVFLSMGLVLGGRWAYDVLGWGGFWGWDPVENASFMPWLTGTAFLHSVMIQEKRGMLKVWNIILIILTYSLVLFGTFITRSGVISSVHSFGNSLIGPAFFAFIGVTLFASLYVLFTRLDTLKSDHEMDSLFSREAVFLLQNMLFLAITFATFWGTVFPMISELVTGTKITVGPPYYNKVNGPIFAVLVLLMGIAPLFAWRKQSAKRLGKLLWIPFAAGITVDVVLFISGIHSVGALIGYWLVTFVGLAIISEYGKGIKARIKHGENLPTALVHLIKRNRRRYGGYIIHLGVVMIALGVVGTHFFQQETQGMLRPGESLAIGKYTMTFESLRQYSLEGGDRQITEATASLYKNGKFIRTMKPRKDFFISSGQPMSIASVFSSPGEDVYVLLVAWEDVGLTGSTFKIYLNPLVNWVWAGGLTFILGTLIAAWPSRKPVTSWSDVRRVANQPALGATVK